MIEKTTAMAVIEADDGYHELERLVAQRGATLTPPCFATDADPDALWSAYIDNIPVERRRHYTCSACRHFLQRYGGLVKIDPTTGTQTSVFWDGEGVPAFFRAAVAALNNLAVRARVVGPFISSRPVWGTPQTGVWSHLSATNPAVHTSRVKTASQVVAEKVEEYGMLCRGLAEYPADVVRQALRVLRSDVMYRSEKALGAAEWLDGLHTRLEGLRGTARSNVIWAAAATAPVGFCHVKTMVISTLMDDIIADVPAEVMKRKWADKLRPDQYQRPTAPPSSGAIDQAEKLVEQLGLAPAFRRRFATLDDVLVKLWVPAPPREEARSGGLFDHLRPNRPGAAGVALPRVKITWEKFARTVLPMARTMEALTPPFGMNGPFYGLVTASDPSAPPILQWDGLEGHPRNPVSWFFYTDGSPPSRWGLASGAWVKVNAVFLPPHQWQAPEKFAHQGLIAFFALEGCRDVTRGLGLALFPETLRSELHGVRAVVEAHSNKGRLEGTEAGNANGLAFQKSGRSSLVVRVDDGGGTAEYEIDRWD